MFSPPAAQQSRPTQQSLKNAATAKSVLRRWGGWSE